VTLVAYSLFDDLGAMVMRRRGAGDPLSVLSSGDGLIS